MNSFSTHAQYRTDASARSPSYARHTIARSPPLCSRQLRVRQSQRPAVRRGDDRRRRLDGHRRVQAHVSWSVRSLIEYRQPWRFPCCHHLPNVCPYTCTRRVGDRAARHDHSRAQEEDGRGAHHGNRTDILPYIVTSQHDAEHIHSCARSSGSTSPPRPPCRSSRAPPACRPHRRRTISSPALRAPSPCATPTTGSGRTSTSSLPSRECHSWLDVTAHNLHTLGPWNVPLTSSAVDVVLAGSAAW